MTTDLQGRPTAGGRASTEILMHTAVYARRPDVTAVVHAHPPTATGFAVAGIPLDRPLVAEAVVALGPVPSSPTACRPRRARGQRGRAICDAHALLLAHHGALAVGDSLWRAWERMETLEQLARVALVARQTRAARTRSLPRTSHRLEAARAAAGYPAPACLDCPACGTNVPLSGNGEVMLTRDELVRIVAEAVEKFGRAY